MGIHGSRYRVSVQDRVKFDAGRAAPLAGRTKKSSSSVRVKLVSSFNIFRRRWTVHLYWRSCFEVNNHETTFIRTELGVEISQPERGARCTRRWPQSGVKSPFSNLSLALALYGIQRRAVQNKAFVKDDLIQPGRAVPCTRRRRRWPQFENKCFT